MEESHAEVTYGDLPVVIGDELQLGQLFQNLIGNALKFRGPDVPRIHISAREREEEWEFCIRDNGIGIEIQHLYRIFQLFQRLHKRGDYPGTGIGLTICKKIVEGHGGTIWAESDGKTGSAFFFTIPKST
jgi:light-regulated signal transduction histidine kinase (bacteriophytochrome)